MEENICVTPWSNWLEAARLRTLPLSSSGVVLGCGLAAAAGYFRLSVLILSLILAVLLQILSNFANDYGDAVKGSDGPGRAGPRRAVASGAISPNSMRHAVILLVFLCVLATIQLLAVSFGTDYSKWTIFSILAIASMAAAVFYTMGRHPYGYIGLGDLFVFIFFGPVAVAGAFALYDPHFSLFPLLPACATGLFATAVLNINNIRDMENDRANGKRTLAQRLGGQRARLYHLGLIGVGVLCWLLWLVIYGYWTALPLLFCSLPLLRSAYVVYVSKNATVLDAQLRITSVFAGIFNLIMAVAIPWL